MEPSTKDAESADVMKKMRINSIASVLVIMLNGNSANMANRAISTSELINSANPPAPYISIFKPVPPNVVNQMTASNEAQ
ncbi:hypothetical protein JCM21714_4407 [Gracilibacillus boraciitolerans JCM 21714]|uniref:Uncharacterized protein n=1 Tax=Gracilibacillus boraciitolerans JCM 21714 TaxID=1298598 RepID=W4VQL9_9BACI|nr:hypothetical protein JCM21714_4407 [Gracilibacillus boraciitolerans JCM 21714]